MDKRHRVQQAFDGSVKVQIDLYMAKDTDIALKALRREIDAQEIGFEERTPA